MKELLSQFRAITRDRPVTADELEAARRSLLGMWAGRLAIPEELARWMSDAVALGLGEDYYTRLIEECRRVTLREVNDAAAGLGVSPTALVVVGDKTQLEPQLRDLGYGELHVVPVSQR